MNEMPGRSLQRIETTQRIRSDLHPLGCFYPLENLLVDILYKILPLLFLTMLGGCTQEEQPHLRLVNLAHLNHLYEEVTIAAMPMAIVHIYSEYPDYGWVNAGDEGIACVDDAARAAVLYLRHFEITCDTLSLHRARRLIDFCRHLQDEDGRFYNFIFADHSINRTGQTSYKSLGWWTARAVWAMGEGYRVWRERDPAYAAALQDHLQKAFTHIDSLLQHYPRVDTVNGFAVPRWLLHNSAADATSELVLGLSAYYRASGDARVKAYLQRFGEAFVISQLGDRGQFPYGAIRSWHQVWHGWGNAQTQGLATLAGELRQSEFLAASSLEADSFFRYVQREGFPREMEFAKSGEQVRLLKLERFPQIAYALRPMIVGSLRLAEASGQARFAELAGDLATWFFGKNAAAAQMYDPASGRGFDGILSETEINRNAGAESTIEALYAILEVEANPIARQRLYEAIGVTTNE